MTLKKIAKIIYVPGTYSEKRPIKVVHAFDQKELWSGTAIELKDFVKNAQTNWSVQEILIDRSNPEEIAPDYNKGKIIVVY